MEFERLVRGTLRETLGLTFLVERKELIQQEIQCRILDKVESELDLVEIQMLKNELEFIDLELKLIDLELKRDAIIATSK